MIATYNTPTTTTIEPITVLAQIIQAEMGLSSEQIAFAYQKFNIPADGLFIVLGYLGPSQSVASQTYFDPILETETQGLLMRHMIKIEAMSMAPDNSARIRKEEISLALRSQFSQQLQEQNQIGIAWLQGDYIDATSFEETAMLNRYIITAAVHALHQKTKPSSYFSSFPIALTDASQDGRNTTVQIDPTKSPFTGA